jgi:glycine/D-amino acid oxidase-like deaminating enzyme
VKDPGTLSLWHDLLPQPIVPRDPLTGRHEFDVAIVGGGYTGLWTAYYLAKADPHLRICLLEKVFCGFGASGRNGGWCSAHFPASLPKMAASSGRAAAVAQIRELFSTIDEIARVLGEEGIEASWHKGGTLRIAVNAAQVEGLRRRLADQRAWGFAEDDYVWQSADEARSRVNVGAAVAGHYTPHCAAFDPARLAVGLVAAVERLGVRVFEQSPVLGFDDRRLELASGSVSADVIVLAMEAYAADMPRWHRDLIPLYSLMVATEPLSARHLEQIGWENRECFTDGRHLTVYLQRTADGRIAMGGRGAPYHFGSRVLDTFDGAPRVFRHLRESLLALFPALGDVGFTHSWGGPLGVPRDWYSSVTYERASGYACACGYVGNGVGISNLAGRTLRDLILGVDSDIVHLPWVNHRSPQWETEPWRWMAINSALRLMGVSDVEERLAARPSRLAGVVDKLVGM